VYRASLYDGLTGREPARVYTASDSELAEAILESFAGCGEAEHPKISFLNFLATTPSLGTSER
jgi:hypothetical protein